MTQGSVQSAGENPQSRGISFFVWFLRKIVPWLAAYGAFRVFLLAIRAISSTPLTRWDFSTSIHGLVGDLIAKHLPDTLLLLGAALLLGVLVSLAFAGMPAGETGAGRKSDPARIGRHALLILIALPALILAFITAILFGEYLRWLPFAGIYSPRVGPGFLEVLRHTILPVVCLALAPIAFSLYASKPPAGQPLSGNRRKTIRFLTVLKGIFRQTGGILAADVVVEAFFAWPGIGNFIYRAASENDLPLLTGCLAVAAGIILAGQVLAELCDLLLGSIRAMNPAASDSPAPMEKPGAIRNVVLIGLSVIAALIVVIGFFVPSKGNPFTDFAPSFLHGTSLIVFPALASAVFLVVISLPVGALAAWLAGLRRWWAVALSELLLLPANANLMLPALIWGLLIVSLLPSKTTAAGMAWWQVALIAGAALQPRGIRFVVQSWAEGPEGKTLPRLGKILWTLFLLGTAFSFGLILSLSYLETGVLPYSASFAFVLNRIVAEGQAFPLALLIAWYIPWVLFLLADGATGNWKARKSWHWINS